jgi:hypothetical protein
MKNVDVELSIFLIGVFLCVIVAIIGDYYNDLMTKKQYTNNLEIVINCRKSHAPNILVADRICGPVPQWATHNREAE